MSEIESPQLSWKENKTPQSDRFGDVYFSVDDGLAESTYVFLDGCEIQTAFTQKDHFTIAETGFGTGLNFLLTWKAWKEAKTDCRLHFISVEGFPLTKDQLRNAYEAFPSIADYAEEFLEHYPVLTKGYHHVVLEGGKVKLTLMLGEAEEMYSQLEAKVDAWYLDGFSPAKNPEMWRAEVFEQIGRLSIPGTVLSTFTAAGFVKRGLRDVGFEMSKRRGFGRKRDSLIGSFLEGKEHPSDKPWLKPAEQSFASKKIAVIGAGAAGVMSAYRLQQDGHDVTVFERNSYAGSQGSGNQVGIVKPRLSVNQSGNGQFNTAAYVYAIDFYDQLDAWVGERGLYHMAQDDEELDAMKKLFLNQVLPVEEMLFLSADDASDRIGLDLKNAGLWFERSGCVEPAKLCQKIAEGLEVRYEKNITSLEKTDGWTLTTDKGESFKADVVVVTTAGEVKQLLPDCELPMGGRRGQVSYVECTDETKGVKHAISCGAYFLPTINDEHHIVGASFERWSDFEDHGYEAISTVSNDENAEKLKNIFPDLVPHIIGARASIRAMSIDHMPIVGPIYSKDDYIERYENIRHGKKHKKFDDAVYREGLYVMTGLGARGVQTAPFLANVLSSYITGAPSPIEREMRENLHPARFFIRALKRGKQ